MPGRSPARGGTRRGRYDRLRVKREPIEDAVTGEAFRRIVGARPRPPIGEPPSRTSREALAQMARYRTGAPKGVFRYRSHEDANRAREEWTIAAAISREAIDAKKP